MRKTITKKEMTSIVAEKMGFAQLDVKDVIDTFLEEVVLQFSQGNKITLRGFGSFIPHHRRACKYRDPNTGQEMTMEAQNTLRFKASKKIVFRDES